MEAAHRGRRSIRFGDCIEQTNVTPPISYYCRWRSHCGARSGKCFRNTKRRSRSKGQSGQALCGLLRLFLSQVFQRWRHDHGKFYSEGRRIGSAWRGDHNILAKVQLCQAGGAIRAEEVRRIRQWVDAAELLGAPHVRLFAGSLPGGASEKQGVEWVVEAMKAACDYAAKRGITLGIENHGGMTARAATTLDILRQVDSPYAGINLDISNFEGKTDDEMYSDIQACVPYATHAHIRDLFGTTKRPIDVDRVWRLFAQGGYKGYMSAEYESEEDPMTGVPKLTEKIKVLCRKYSSA